MALAAVVSFLQTPTYRASSEVLMGQVDTASAVGSNDAGTSSADATRRLYNEVRLLESGVVLDAVEEAYEGHLDPSQVSAAVESDSSDVIRVSLTSTDRAEAVTLVDLYVQTFFDVRREMRAEELFVTSAELQSQIDTINGQITEARQPLDALDAQIATAPEDERAALLTERATLERQVEAQVAPLDDRLSYFEAQLQDLQVGARIADAAGATVLTPATTGDGSISPQPVRNIALATVLGLIIGVAGAFVLEALDDRMRGTGDIELVHEGLALLAEVPVDGHHRGRAFVATRDEPHGRPAEAFRQLRTAVEFALLDEPAKIIQVTSPSQGEGKTTVAANLAVAYARSGAHVALVCCDLRRPRLHEAFDQPVAPGLTDVLADESGLGDTIRRVDLDMVLLTAGSPTASPSELLGSGRAERVIVALSKRFDIVVIDSTPTLPVADALLVSRIADATIVVTDSRSTHRSSLRRCLQMLDQVHARTLGVVLNRVPATEGYGYDVARSAEAAAPAVLPPPSPDERSPAKVDGAVK